jgi:hypothetical protein
MGALAAALVVVIVVGIGEFTSQQSRSASRDISNSFNSSALANSVSSSLKTADTNISSTSNELRTCTVIPNLSYMFCGGPTRISASGEVGSGPGQSSAGGDWNFTVTINSDSLIRGQNIRLVANLTNIGQNISFSNGFVEPYINPGVYATNGTEVWAWDPSEVIVASTIAAGETISQDVGIPTSQLTPGQSYLIELAPISVQFPTPNNLTFTFQFSVQ